MTKSMKNSKNHITPPGLARKLLSKLLKEELLEEVLGDLDEHFLVEAQKKGLKSAKRDFWRQAFHYMRPFALKSIKTQNANNINMYHHFLKISWRNLIRNKLFSSIKIGGFAIGIAACLIIALYVQRELSYDQHYQNQDRIFRLANNYTGGEESDRWVNLHGPFKEVLEEHLPEAELISRAVFWAWGNAGANHIKKIEDPLNTYEKGFFYADPEFLEILEVPMVYGNAKDALNQPNHMVISKSQADKYYPGENPVGRQMILNGNTEDTYTIGGVMEDFPETSHVKGEFILTLFGRTSGPGASGWCCTNYAFYTRLTQGADAGLVAEKIKEIRNTYVIDELEQAGNSNLEDVQTNYGFFLQPVSDIYLNRANVGDQVSHGSADTIWIFSVVALIVLILACLNFVNLSTARSIKKSKEVGVRKAVGSFRSTLIKQYISESVFLGFLSVLLSVGMAWLVLPYFNQIADMTLSIPWSSPLFSISLVSVALVIGVLSGLYPAFYLSRFKPVDVLKGGVRHTNNVRWFQNGLVILQFTATVVLIIGALVMDGQFNYLMNKSLGYDKEQVVNVEGLSTLDNSTRKVFKEELLSQSFVQSASLSDFLPVEGGAENNLYFWPSGGNKDTDRLEAARWVVDRDYLQTLGIKLKEGREFRRSGPDSTAIIINNAMAERLQYENPVGEQVTDMFNNTYTIVGITDEFYFESLYYNVRPLAMVLGSGKSTISLKIKTDDIQAAMTSIQEAWDGVKPDQNLRYSFMDQRFARMYTDMERSRSIFIIFSVLSIVVASLGLFALSAFSIEQRAKEVSIRKVLGASVSRIFIILSQDFLKLVLIAIVIALPLGKYIMNEMLHELANRIEISWLILGMAAVMAIIIAVITISFESVKAALTNPISRLRSE